ncbi:MAG: hypothetical protein K0R97_2655 [Oerskovia sp.]|nr:hypothetical protein [Oerskovia sp.]
MSTRTAVALGANVRPMPTPASTKAGTSSAYVAPEDTIASQARARVWRVRPVTSRVRIPRRGASTPAIGATSMGAAVQGSVRTPASSGERPSAIWKYWMSRNTAPNMPSENAKPDTFATAKLRERNRRRGTSGEPPRRARRCSQATKAAIRRTDPASSESTTADVQPSSLPRTMPQTPAKTPVPASARPTRSIGPRRPNDSRSATNTSGTATSATGTLIQKMASQLMPSTTAPPTSGPSATPRPETPPQIPIASARLARGTASAMRARDSGMIAAAPAPWTARAAMSAEGVSATAHATDASVNTAIPTTKTRRRPNRSPSEAATSMRVANASV